MLLVQLHPHVGVQFQVQRPHLLPEAIELLGELVGRHVVLRTPHRAGVAEAELARAFVRQLHEPRVVLPHRRRDGVPAFPDLEQPLGVAHLRHHLGDVVDVQAGIGVSRVGAPLAFAVGAVEPRHDGRQLFGLLGIGGRGHHERRLQDGQLTALVGGQLQVVEPRRLLHVAGDRVDVPLVGARAQRFRVGGDEVLLDPARLARLDAELQHGLVDRVEKRLRVFGCRLGRRLRARAGEGSEQRSEMAAASSFFMRHILRPLEHGRTAEGHRAGRAAPASCPGYGAMSGWAELPRNSFKSLFGGRQQRVAGGLIAIPAQAQKAFRPRHMRFERPHGRAAQPGKIHSPGHLRSGHEPCLFAREHGERLLERVEHAPGERRLAACR